MYTSPVLLLVGVFETGVVLVDDALASTLTVGVAFGGIEVGRNFIHISKMISGINIYPTVSIKNKFHNQNCLEPALIKINPKVDRFRLFPSVQSVAEQCCWHERNPGLPIILSDFSFFL